ncbi:MAG: flotillin-like FloA family protein, partial [Bacteroidota bacterium]
MTEFSFLIWIGIAIASILIFFYFVPVNLWIVAVFSGVNVGLVTLIFMRLRKVPPGLIVQSMILAT